MQPQSLGISWIIEPELKKGGLLLSGFILSQDLTFLLANNIHAVLSLLPKDSNKQSHYYEPPIEGRILQVEDDDPQDLSRILDQAYDWIQEKRHNTNVLIHCATGEETSPIVTVYYLMRKNGWSYEEGIIFVRERRGSVRPRRSSVEQIKECIRKHEKPEVREQQ